jgi:hypothetical protein
MDFIIFSLPRSGSAWLSNFLTYDDVFCYHDGFRGTTVWPQRAAPVSGVCDTGAYLLNVSAPLEFVLLRNPYEIDTSLAKLNLTINDLHLNEFYSRTKNSIPIHYSLLFNVNYLEELWYKFTSAKFNYARAEMLIDLNIQQDVAKALSRSR